MGFIKNLHHDPAWVYCSPTKDVKNGTICKFCNKRIGGGGINRFKYHLSGLKGHNISACKKVPQNVRSEILSLFTSETGVQINTQSKKILKQQERASKKTHKRYNNESSLCKENEPETSNQERSEKEDSLIEQERVSTSKNLIPKEKKPFDPAWAYCSPAKDVKSGTICSFCDKRIGGGGINRFKYHLSGLKGHNISGCKKVPQNVRNEILSLYIAENGVKVRDGSKKIVKHQGPSTNLRKKTNKRYKSIKHLDTDIFDSPLCEEKDTEMSNQGFCLMLKNSLEPCTSNARITRSSSLKKNNTDQVDKSVVDIEPNREMLHGSQSEDRADFEPTSSNLLEHPGGDADISNEPLDSIPNPSIEPNPNFDNNPIPNTSISNDSSEPNTKYNTNPISIILNSNQSSMQSNPNSSSNPISITLNSNQSSTEPNPNSDTNPIFVILNSNQSSTEPNPNSNRNPNGSLIERTLQNPSWFSLAEDSLIEMTPSIWKFVEERLEVFKRNPQMPHFKKLESCHRLMREGMAIGMIANYGSLANSMKNLSFDDDVKSVEEKIAYLDTLEENGFNIDWMKTCLKGLLEIKSESELQLSERKSDLDRNLVVLDEIGRRISDLKRHVGELAGAGKSVVEDEIEKILNFVSVNKDEILRKKNQIMKMDSGRESFARVLTEFTGTR